MSGGYAYVGWEKALSIGSAVGEIWKAIPERRGSRGKNRMLCIRTGCAAASAAAEIELARVLRWRSESEAGGSIGLSFAGMSAGLERFVHRPSALLPPSFGRQPVLSRYHHCLPAQ